MKKLFLLATLGLCLSGALDAQQLLSPSFGFSQKKTSYITMQDGSEITGTIKNLDRKKGLIEMVTIETGDGKKTKLKAQSIKMMYLPPTNFDNMTKAVDFASNASKWDDEKLNGDLIKEGYVYFENAKVKIKKEESFLLMQLLNPTFCEKVRVYHDPYADETSSVGVGGVTVAGGEAKSYYVLVEGSNAAAILNKKDYKKQFAALWKNCPEMKQKYPEMKWSDFTQNVIDYNTCAK